MNKAINISRGLGDSIAKGLKKIGVKPCNGCKKRVDKLNKAIPYINNIDVTYKEIKQTDLNK